MVDERLPENDAAALLAAAGEALSAGRWEEARDGFQATLEIEESGGAVFGLALALWWLHDPVTSIRLQERAFGMFRRHGDYENAFFAAMYLCLGYDMTFGNLSASKGWLAKAARVVQDSGLVDLRGWVLLCEAVTLHHQDLVAAEEKARKALDAARETNDADLDVCARSQLGAALVELGRTNEGTALLDEAMAGALGGEVQTLDSVVLASCRTITSCSRAADVTRAIQWIRAATRFNEKYGSPHLYTTCRIHYARVLLFSGQWALAEAELKAALSVGRLVEPELYAEALALLGNLRVIQGRVGEAEQLIAGYEQHAAVVPVLAAIRAVQGQFEVAEWLVRRRLDLLVANPLAAVELQGLLVELEIKRGRSAEALSDADALFTAASRLGIPAVLAGSHYLLGRALAAVGNDTAARELDWARTIFIELEMPYQAARSRLALARFTHPADKEAAAEEAKGALATFEELGAAPDADAAAAMLREWGVKAARRGPNAIGSLTAREREILGLLGEGLSNREIAARLFITPKTVEHHVGHVLTKLDLKRRGEAAAFAVRNLPST
jgi:DNA-binding CsgD family transcriptional regulator/tetratricopeptide (TPR) repeat protein